MQSLGTDLSEAIQFLLIKWKVDDDDSESWILFKILLSNRLTNEITRKGLTVWCFKLVQVLSLQQKFGELVNTANFP